MEWRLAESLKVLRDQVNERWPDRNKSSDGSIGDQAHQHRISDHDPDKNGVVTAIDITHDPRSGCDSYALADILRGTRDQRIKYIISNRRICSSYVDPWVWRPYNGANPHNHHMHISVLDIPAKYDDKTPWNLASASTVMPQPNAPIHPPILKKGDSGPVVTSVQGMLVKHGIAVSVDGQFGDETQQAVEKFQEANGLVSDGIIGPQTWNALQ